VPSVAGERPLQHHLPCRVHHQRQIDTEGHHRIFFKKLTDTITVTSSYKELNTACQEITVSLIRFPILIEGTRAQDT
jgi:hypothetical protein